MSKVVILIKTRFWDYLGHFGIQCTFLAPPIPFAVSSDQVGLWPVAQILVWPTWLLLGTGRSVPDEKNLQLRIPTKNQYLHNNRPTLSFPTHIQQHLNVQILIKPAVLIAVSGFVPASNLSELTFRTEDQPQKLIIPFLLSLSNNRPSVFKTQLRFN